MSGLLVLLLQIGFWWFLFRIIRTAASKGKKAANEQRKQDAAPSAQPVRPSSAPQRPVPAKKDRTAPSPRLQQDDYARKAASAAPRPTPPRPRTVVMEGSPEPHVVAPSFGKNHAHTESSMTGFEDCPPEQVHLEHSEETEVPEAAQLSFAGQEIIKAMLYSEILSKPKALR